MPQICFELKPQTQRTSVLERGLPMSSSKRPSELQTEQDRPRSSGEPAQESHVATRGSLPRYERARLCFPSDHVTWSEGWSSDPRTCLAPRLPPVKHSNPQDPPSTSMNGGNGLCPACALRELLRLNCKQHLARCKSQFTESCCWLLTGIFCSVSTRERP